jgi:CBS domain-containing protein/ribosome-associated translation inhibitor RaiA
MDIRTIVSTEYEELTASTPVSKLVGLLQDVGLVGVVVTDDDGYRGVVTRRQLTASHYQPNQTVGSLVWHVPRVEPDADVREVARLMLDGDTRLLPVFEGDDLVGVVTADDLLAAVEEFLDVASVADVVTTDLVTVAPEDTFGTVLNTLREHRFTHLPVVEEGRAVGILSLYDVTELSARATDRSQGGDAGGTDAVGGKIPVSAGGSHGGRGAREGELDRMLDLPVRDLMVSPVETIDPAVTLRTAVRRMLETEVSSLVVTTDGSPFGIVTKSDVLDALTWETENTRAVQVTGMDLMDDLTYPEVVDMIDGLDGKDDDRSVFDAKLHLHEHDETNRGTPLLLARLRLYTNRGNFIASGEGYGASQAVNQARDVMERQLRDAKTKGQSKKHPDEAFWEKRFGWMLEA